MSPPVIASRVFARFFPGLSTLFVLLLVSLIFLLAASQSGRILGVFGFQSKADLRSQVSMLEERITSLQNEINDKSLQLEAMAERHQKELEAVQVVVERTNTIKEELEVSKRQLETRNTALTQRLRAAQREINESGQFDLDRYIVIPREEAEQISANNYDTLASFLEGSELSPPSVQSFATGPPDHIAVVTQSSSNEALVDSLFAFAGGV